MLIYEQRIYEEMIDLIPKTFDPQETDELYKAARTWRLPYWDWAVKKPEWNAKNPNDPVNTGPATNLNVPFVITQENVQVRGRAGKAISLSNPMYNFGLPEDKRFGDYGVGSQRNTYVRILAS